MKRLVALFTALCLLAACSTSTQSQASQAVADAVLIMGTTSTSATCPAGPCGLAGAYAELKRLYPTLVTPAVDAQVTTILNAAPTTLAALQAAVQAQNTSGQATSLQAIVADATAIVGALSPILAPLAAGDPEIAAILAAINAASILAPILTASIEQMAPPTVTASRATARYSDHAPKPSRAEAARAALRL